MKHWKSVLAVGALSLASMIGLSSAQEPPKGGDHRLQFMATALDLTDAQVAQIKQIRGDKHTMMQANHQQMKSLHEQLQAVITADNFDEAKASALIAQVQQLQAAQMLDHAREMNAIYKILNPQQKAKAVKLFGEMHGGMGGPHGHGGPGSADGPPPPQQD